jgi:hypothetical protein
MFDKHPRASMEGYRYNEITIYSQPSKIAKGVWAFSVNDLKDVDLMSNNYNYSPKKKGGYSITTEGSPSIMYAYNAIVDAKMELQNPNSELSQKWNKLIKRYIG